MRISGCIARETESAPPSAMEDTKASLMLSRLLSLTEDCDDMQARSSSAFQGDRNNNANDKRPSASHTFRVLQDKLKSNLPNVANAISTLHAEAKGVTHYGVSLTRTVDVLGENGVYLDEFEVAYIEKRFSNHRGEVNFHEVVQACNVGKPSEHLEPELMLDTIPQPFRLVIEVFEEEIFDAAWFEIIRRHPDIEIDSDGNQIVLPRNRNLEEKVAPSVIVSSKPTSIVSLVACSVGPFSFGVTSSGVLLTIESSSGRIVNSIASFHDVENVIEGKNEQEGNGSDNPELVSQIVPSWWVASVTGPFTEDGLFRVVVVRSQENLGPPPDENESKDTKSKKGAKSSEPDPTTTFKPHSEAKISVIEVKVPRSEIYSLSEPNAFSSYVAYSLPNIEADTLAHISIDLSPDGQVLMINHGLSLSYYIMDQPRSAVDKTKIKNRLTGILEDRELDEFGAPSLPVSFFFSRVVLYF